MWLEFAPNEARSSDATLVASLSHFLFQKEKVANTQKSRAYARLFLFELVNPPNFALQKNTNKVDEPYPRNTYENQND